MDAVAFQRVQAPNKSLELSHQTSVKGSPISQMSAWCGEEGHLKTH